MRARQIYTGAASGCGLRLHECWTPVRCSAPSAFIPPRKKDPKDNEAVNALLPNITLEFAFIEGEQHIYLNGEDVSTAIRTEEWGWRLPWVQIRRCAPSR